ncbi:hypothetical protein CONPUDRAFT_78228 [Coniophora puteana RWD-64-598 SS2]|uniref:Uncharacterized protein n=1 Tax=Coniophora puteana (strain RWD-64-598) TaxID=741705 RepID=R7SDN3_CONPW|nr:uncharacterized protein CONPUDRAFT_78228 [Coniophora puteana RWD-64-598 SS2]EIW74271.1 hypothetical protein CONPUDRAFT_78228 [Coniophora puteana RWD-64-598 SS2]
MSNTTSEIIAEVENQLTLNRGLLAGFVFMTYDYVASPKRSLAPHHYTQTRRFSAMTFIYILFRYLGLLWGISFVVFILNEPAQDVLLFLLQAMLTMRVYLLFGKSKLVLLCLVVGFLAAQGVSFTIAFMTWVIGPSLEQELNIAYLHTCEVHLPTSFAWFSPASNSTLLGFEVMLSGFALSALFGLVVNIIAGAPFANPVGRLPPVLQEASHPEIPVRIMLDHRKAGTVLISHHGGAVDDTQFAEKTRQKFAWLQSVGSNRHHHHGAICVPEYASLMFRIFFLWASLNELDGLDYV